MRSTKFAIASSAASNCAARQRDGKRRLGLDHGVPRDQRVEVREDLVRFGIQEIAECRIELAAATLPYERPRSLDAADPVRDLHELAELRETRRERDRVRREIPGPSLSVPHLVRRAERGEHLVGQLELLAERSGHRGVVIDHVVDLAMAREEKLEPDAEAVQRRVAGSDPPHPGRGHANTPQLVVVLHGFQRDVVSEPFRLLVSVRMAAHVDEQGGVVDDGAGLVVHPEAFGQAQRNQALAQDVLHRLSEAEIDPERERCDELRQPDVWPITGRAHAPQV